MAAVLHLPEQKVILKGVSWETYERLLAEHEGESDTRFTYDSGILEILVPSVRHEKPNRILASLVEVLAIDLTVDPPPDLVIEIDITSPSLDKFPLYAVIGVPEVWRYDGTHVTMHRLAGERYVEVTHECSPTTVDY
jgi:Uma2 family endonuclease